MSERIVHRPTLRAGVRLFALFLVTTPPAPYLNVPYKKLFHRLPVDRQIRSSAGRIGCWSSAA